jgi:voltage-gated potassium channel
MLNKMFITSNRWNTVLFVSVLFASFIVPLLPPGFYQRTLFKIAYNIIYFAAIFTLEKHRKIFLSLFISAIGILWISAIFDLTFLEDFSKGLNILCLLVIVVFLIQQITTAKNVSERVIVDSISGYLLLGMIFSILIAFILQNDPNAYNYPNINSPDTENRLNLSVPIYYAYITLASVGYGDIVPLKPYTRSLATFIAISGQFYVTVIIALLIGKYSSRQVNEKNPNDLI